MADQVNIDLLGQAYCNVLTRKTGIKHTYTIKGKDGEKQNEQFSNNEKSASSNKESASCRSI